jgi:hypothetical protein
MARAAETYRGARREVVKATARANRERWPEAWRASPLNRTPKKALKDQYGRAREE